MSEIETGDVEISEDEFKKGFIRLDIYDRLKSQTESQLAAIKQLREVLKAIIKEHRIDWACEHQCNCRFCDAEYALAASSGFEEGK